MRHNYGHSLQMQVLYLSFCNKCCLFFIANSSCLFISLALGSWGLWIISVKFHWHFTEISVKEFSNISVKYHWNFSEIILHYFSEMSLKFQWNITKFQWNFTEIRWNAGELFHWYFCEILVIFHWNFSDYFSVGMCCDNFCGSCCDNFCNSCQITCAVSQR